jgi:hypothetical protein
MPVVGELPRDRVQIVGEVDRGAQEVIITS